MKRDKGFALAAVILALLLLGELVSWGLLVSLAESREGLSSRELERSFEAAEEGLARIVSEWAEEGSGVSVYRGNLSQGRSYLGSVVRLNSGLVLIRVEGRSGRGSAGAKVAQMARIQALQDGKKALRKLRERGWLEAP